MLSHGDLIRRGRDPLPLSPRPFPPLLALQTCFKFKEMFWSEPIGQLQRAVFGTSYS